MNRTMARLWTTAAVLGFVAGCHTMPPASMLMHPGPGVGGPGPGVMGGAPVRQFPANQSQVFFAGPEGVQISWQMGPEEFSPPQITAPGRYNFFQGRLYRLKLTEIPGRPGVELYPTLELAPGSPKTDAYLSHNPIPVAFTEEDFDQVLAGNYVTKAVFLPDPEHQELAIAGVETLVSTRLEPGADPMIEADRRGTILAIIRLGNIDLEMPGSDMAVMMGPDGPVVMTGAEMSAYMVDPQVMAAGGVISTHGQPAVAGSCATGDCPHAMGGVGQGVGPSWGMPMTATPIGLPGPPHIPLGGPAGLQKHTIRNWTHTYIPEPTEELSIDVKHTPGIHVPDPVENVKIEEVNFPWPF